MSSKKIIEKLLKLKEANFVPVSFFDHSLYFKSVLHDLLKRRIIDKVPAKRKGTWCYMLLDDTKLQTFINKIIRESIPDNMDKVDAVQFTGNAHNADFSRYSALPLRAFSADMKISLNGTKIDPFSLTLAGAALYLPVNTITGNVIFPNNANIALVENQRVFWEIEHILPKINFVLYLQGNFSTLTAQTLMKSLTNSFCTYLGDYDPVGISLYLRIKKYLPHCSFYIPDNIESLFNKYGNSIDLVRQNQFFNTILNSNDKDVIRIRKIFETTSKTLQQEALLIQ
jgi:hypothetical protein